MLTVTFVVSCETNEQQKLIRDMLQPMWFREEMPSITGASGDDELHRVNLITEALDLDCPADDRIAIVRDILADHSLSTKSVDTYRN